MQRWILRGTMSALAITGVMAVATPASAGNSDPWSPNPASRAAFCTNPVYTIGGQFHGTANNDKGVTWIIGSVTDYPGYTVFTADADSDDRSGLGYASWECG